MRTVETLIEATCSLDEQLWPAIADRVQFEVALLNLAANARDAMPLGGKLLFMTRNVTLDSASAPGHRAGDYVQISVTDTGEGMTKETQAKACEPFFTTKGVGKGTGLGLSQVYGFAEQLRGTVRINSAVGEGTTITIWLPRAEAMPAPGAGPAVSDPGPGAALKILLVDDDHAVRSPTEEMLTELGHAVVAAENGPAALALLSTETEFDLLLADFAMPVMNGAQVAAEAIKLQPGIAVLFISGYADAGVLGSWTELGYRKLDKPFSSEELDAAIRQTVRPRPGRGNLVPLPRKRG
jgi:CheY-like chemotaxis protein